jgi:Protein of unknown function (DUF2877)
VRVLCVPGKGCGAARSEQELAVREVPAVQSVRPEPHRQERRAGPTGRRIAAETIGCRVARTARGGRVEAVFQHACNLKMNNGALVTVLAGRLGNVAHGIRLRGDLPPYGGMRVGARVHLDGERLVLFAAPWQVILTEAHVWTPDLRIGAYDGRESAPNAAVCVHDLFASEATSSASECLTIVLRRHREISAASQPHREERAAGARLDGWIYGTDSLPSFETHRHAMLLRMRSENVSFICRRGLKPDSDAWSSDAPTPLATRISGVLLQLEPATRAGDPAAALRPVAQLVGLGPGLTPAGDDFIIGWLAGLTLTATTPERKEFLHAMCSGIRRLRFATTSVSSQHLDDACALMFSERLSDLCTAIAAGAPPPVLAARVAAQLAVGATSGADAAAGLMFALFYCGDQQLNH